METLNFYSVIIGTELLNGRRVDSHFPFINGELLKRGHEHKGSFVITDKPEFMSNVYNLVKEDPHSVMFSFGGIGSTPDDYTREVAAQVFTGKEVERNKEALKIIEEKFQEEAYPHRVKMADLPVGCELIPNPISKVPGFGIDGRFFFVPGFPEMAQPMVSYILEKHFQAGAEKFRKTITVATSEDKLIDLMTKLPEEIELSSLPGLIIDNKRKTVLSLSTYDKELLDKWYEFSINEIRALGIDFKEGDL